MERVFPQCGEGWNRRWLRQLQWDHQYCRHGWILKILSSFYPDIADIPTHQVHLVRTNGGRPPTRVATILSAGSASTARPPIWRLPSRSPTTVPEPLMYCSDCTYINWQINKGSLQIYSQRHIFGQNMNDCVAGQSCVNLPAKDNTIPASHLGYIWSTPSFNRSRFSPTWACFLLANFFFVLARPEHVFFIGQFFLLVNFFYRPDLSIWPKPSRARAALPSLTLDQSHKSHKRQHVKHWAEPLRGEGGIQKKSLSQFRIYQSGHFSVIDQPRLPAPVP